MSEPAQAGGHGLSAPSAWVLRGLNALSPGARVLDFASGAGRHARAALSLGHRVTAVDRDAEALAHCGPGVDTLCADLEGGRWPDAPLDWPLAAGSFDALIVCNYLFRPGLSRLASLLAPGGLAIYETFALGHERYGRPSNPDYLLRSAELIDWARLHSLQVWAYEEGFAGGGRQARIQRLLAVRPPADPERFALE